jgi:hypothetical protein
MVDMSAHIDAGVLFFRVSCGPQHIVFSDPRLRVDTGFMQTVELRLSLEVKRSFFNVVGRYMQIRSRKLSVASV